MSLVSRGGLVIIVYFFFLPPHLRLGSRDLGGKGKGPSISHKNMQPRSDRAKGAGGRDRGDWADGVGIRQGGVAG